MIPSIFATLCDVADAFDRYVRDLESGPQRDQLEDLVRRLDEVIDRTVGVTEVHQPHPDQRDDDATVVRTPPPHTGRRTPHRENASTSKPAKPRPCPFCGHAIIDVRRARDQRWEISCRACAATSPPFRLRADAIGAWNQVCAHYAERDAQAGA